MLSTLNTIHKLIGRLCFCVRLNVIISLNELDSIIVDRYSVMHILRLMMFTVRDRRLKILFVDRASLATDRSEDVRRETFPKYAIKLFFFCVCREWNC